MPVLEAAFSRCAIVANDIPSHREIWGDAALYFRTNDAASLAENIRLLNEDRPMRRAYAELAYTRARERFTTKRMIDQYLALYRSLRSAASKPPETLQSAPTCCSLLLWNTSLNCRLRASMHILLQEFRYAVRQLPTLLVHRDGCLTLALGIGPIRPCSA